MSTPKERLDIIQHSLVTSESAAEILGRSIQTISRLAREGVISSLQFTPRLSLFDRLEIENLSKKFTGRRTRHGTL